MKTKKTKKRAHHKSPKKKLVWVDKFHPKNGRLAMPRIRKLPVDELNTWVALGVSEILRYTAKEEFFQRWGSYGPPTTIAMSEWCKAKVAQLLRVLDRRVS